MKEREKKLKPETVWGSYGNLTGRFALKTAYKVRGTRSNDSLVLQPIFNTRCSGGFERRRKETSRSHERIKLEAGTVKPLVPLSYLLWKSIATQHHHFSSSQGRDGLAQSGKRCSWDFSFLFFFLLSSFPGVTAQTRMQA